MRGVREAVRDIAAELVDPLPQAPRDTRPRVRDRTAVPAADRGCVPVRGDARPAQGDRRDQGRHGAADPDGPPHLRRRRLRQDRSRVAGRGQGGVRRQAGRGARADDAAREPARPDVPRALRELPGARRGAVSLPDRPKEQQRGRAGRAGRARSTSSSARTGSSPTTSSSRTSACSSSTRNSASACSTRNASRGCAPTSTCSRSARRRSRARSRCRSPASATCRSCRRRPRIASRSSPTSASTTRVRHPKRSAASCCARARCSSCTTA